MKYFKKLLAAAIAFCMVLPMSACSDTSWVYDYSGEKVPSGVYLGFVIAAYPKAQRHKDYNPEIKELSKQTLDGKPAEQWIKDKALVLCSEYVATEKKFDELKLTYSKEEEDFISQQIDNTWKQLGSFYEDNGVSKSSFNKLMLNQNKISLIFDTYYQEDGIAAVSEKDLRDTFTKEYTAINAFAVPLETGESLTDEQKAKNEELEQNVNEYVKEINSGKAFNEVRNEYAVYNGDTGSNEITADNDTKLYITKETTQLPADISAFVFDEMKPDAEAKSYLSGNYYFILKRYDVKNDTLGFEQNKNILLHEMKDEDFQKMIDEWASALKPIANQASVKKYSPLNVKYPEAPAQQ